VPYGDGYLDELKAQAQALAPGRIHFRPPVAPSKIVATIANYDMGLFLIPPVNFSYHMVLPNKFFEFVMAGLAVAVGPSPAMSALVEQYHLGVVADDFSPATLAQKLNTLSAADIDDMKQHALAAAQELNAETEMAKLLQIYAQLLD